MLRARPSDRLTLEETMNHPWVTKDDLSYDSLSLLINERNRIKADKIKRRNDRIRQKNKGMVSSTGSANQEMVSLSVEEEIKSMEAIDTEWVTKINPAVNFEALEMEPFANYSVNLIKSFFSSRAPLVIFDELTNLLRKEKKYEIKEISDKTWFLSFDVSKEINPPDGSSSDEEESDDEFGLGSLKGPIYEKATVTCQIL